MLHRRAGERWYGSSQLSAQLIPNLGGQGLALNPFFQYTLAVILISPTKSCKKQQCYMFSNTCTLDKSVCWINVIWCKNKTNKIQHLFPHRSSWDDCSDNTMAGHIYFLNYLFFVCFIYIRNSGLTTVQASSYKVAKSKVFWAVLIGQTRRPGGRYRERGETLFK